MHKMSEDKLRFKRSKWFYVSACCANITVLVPLTQYRWFKYKTIGIVHDRSAYVGLCAVSQHDLRDECAIEKKTQTVGNHRMRDRIRG